MTVINHKSITLLHHLRENSREKLTCISKITNIPISTLFDTLKDLQGSIITKSTILLDFSTLGFHTRAHVYLKVKKENKKNLIQHLKCNANINNVQKVNSHWDFFLETIHQNIKDLDEFLEKLEDNYAVVDREVHYLVDDIKREGFFLT